MSDLLKPSVVAETRSPQQAGQGLTRRQSPAPAPVLTASDSAQRDKRSPQPRLLHALGTSLIVIALAGLGALMAVNKTARTRSIEFVAGLIGSHPKSESTAAGDTVARLPERWNGLVELSPTQVEAIGLRTATVERQTRPMKLMINGETAYDPNTQIQIRLRFSGVLDKVHVHLGARVQTGDALIDVFSPELAAAKSDYEKKAAQWEHDEREFARNKKLFESTPPAISPREYFGLENVEILSRKEHKLAADKLMLYGLDEKEIARVPLEDGRQKAKMTLRAPAGGIVTRRDAVPGNRYGENDVLLVIATIDHLWVWGHIYPADASLVEIGQTWVVKCMDKVIPTRIDAIASEIDDQTKTLRIRGEIENPDGRLKADLLVSGYLEIPPVAGRLVIPRIAMISADGADYAFVVTDAKSAGHTPVPSVGTPGDHSPEKARATNLVFERRVIHVLQEHENEVVVSQGLEPGEVVATTGSLILSQMHEDAATTRQRTP